MKDHPGIWEDHQNILVILAHPDDPEFFCGATLASWARSGHCINYLLLTGGEKGGGTEYTPDELRSIRCKEQSKAAAIIGVNSVRILDHEDGMLVPDLDLRREITRAVRLDRPDVVVTCDPTLLFTSRGTINHPDHRAAGQAVLDGLFPAAGNRHFFPELLEINGLLPHTPREVWLALAAQPTTSIDVTDFWEIKIRALLEHHSQIGDPSMLESRLRSRRTTGSTENHPRYEEHFRTLRISI